MTPSLQINKQKKENQMKQQTKRHHSQSFCGIAHTLNHTHTTTHQIQNIDWLFFHFMIFEKIWIHKRYVSRFSSTFNLFIFDSHKLYTEEEERDDENDKIEKKILDEKVEKDHDDDDGGGERRKLY